MVVHFVGPKSDKVLLHTPRLPLAVGLLSPGTHL